MKVDFLFKGSHPAFFWAALLLKQKGKTVAVLPEPSLHSWELFPGEVLEMLGLASLKTDRNENPIQLLTRTCRLGIFGDAGLTKKDLNFSSGGATTPELNRGFSFYAKGSDYPVVFGESGLELLESAHRIDYFERVAGDVELKAIAHLKKNGVQVLENANALPEAEQTVTLDPTRAKVLRKRFEFTLPMKKLPVGATSRMLFIERASPLIELVLIGELLHVRTLLPEEPQLLERMISAIRPYFLDSPLLVKDARVLPEDQRLIEWTEGKSHIDASKPGQWFISPAINPELGERSLYVRLSELLSRKYKKQPLFAEKELFDHI